MKSMRFSRNRRNDLASDRINSPQQVSAANSIPAHDHDCMPEVLQNDGKGHQSKQADVHDDSSPRTVMDVENTSPQANQSPSLQDELTRKKPNQWNRLRTYILSPRKEGNHAKLRDDSSPRPIEDTASRSQRVNRSSDTQDVEVKKNPNQWDRIRSFVLLPKRKAQKQKEVTKDNSSEALRDVITSPSEVEKSALSASPGRGSLFEHNSLNKVAAVVATNSSSTEDDINVPQASPKGGEEVHTAPGLNQRFSQGGIRENLLLAVVDSGLETGGEASSLEKVPEQLTEARKAEVEPEVQERLQSIKPSMLDNLNLHDIESPTLEQSQRLHVSLAYDDTSPNGSTPNDRVNRSAEDRGQSLGSREATIHFETPPVTGSWARLTGAVFSARLNKRQSSETNGTVQNGRNAKSLEDASDSDSSLKEKEQKTSFLRPRVAGKRGDSLGQGHSSFKVAALRSLAQGRAKNKTLRDDDFESPWGVKGEFESGDSFDTDHVSRSFRMSLNGIASMMNPSRTRKRSWRTGSDTASSDDDSSDDITEQQEDGEKIEMFRDAFVDYTLRSLQGSNKNIASRIRTGRRSTLAMFKQ